MRIKSDGIKTTITGVGYTADTYYVRYMDQVIGILTIRVDTYLKDVTFIYKERERKGRK